jgi:hypothetical protein
LKFLILNTDYPEFLRWLYARHQGLENFPYKEQMWVWIESLFGMADCYSKNLKKLDHEAIDIIANHEPIQKQWAIENRMNIRVHLLIIMYLS